MNLFFSVITVVFNDKSGFTTTKASISKQSYKHFEWIVVDGGSLDGTAEEVMRLHSPTIKRISEADGGIYDAMNKGVALASGEYVVFMNAGDVFSSPDVLQLVYDKLLLQEKNIEVLFGGANLIFDDDSMKYRKPRKSSDTIWHGLPATHQATYYRGNFIRKNPYDLQYKMCGDYFLTATVVVEHGEEAYIDKPLVDFRIGDFSFQNPLMALTEAYMIQKTVLHSPLPLRVISFIRRIAAISAVYILFQRRKFKR